MSHDPELIQAVGRLQAAVVDRPRDKNRKAPAPAGRRAVFPGARGKAPATATLTAHAAVAPADVLAACAAVPDDRRTDTVEALHGGAEARGDDDTPIAVQVACLGHLLERLPPELVQAAAAAADPAPE